MVAVRWWRALALGGVLGMLWFVPLDWICNGDVPVLCLFRRLTGHECLGCGMTRAFFSLLHGQWEEALRYNWRCVIVFPLMAYVCARGVLKRELYV